MSNTFKIPSCNETQNRQASLHPATFKERFVGFVCFVAIYNLGSLVQSPTQLVTAHLPPHIHHVAGINWRL